MSASTEPLPWESSLTAPLALFDACADIRAKRPRSSANGSEQLVVTGAEAEVAKQIEGAAMTFLRRLCILIVDTPSPPLPSLSAHTSPQIVALASAASQRRRRSVPFVSYHVHDPIPPKRKQYQRCANPSQSALSVPSRCRSGAANIPRPLDREAGPSSSCSSASACAQAKGQRRPASRFWSPLDWTAFERLSPHTTQDDAGRRAEAGKEGRSVHVWAWPTVCPCALPGRLDSMQLQADVPFPTSLYRSTAFRLSRLAVPPVLVLH